MTVRMRQAALVAAVVAGALATVIGISRYPLETWTIYLANFLFWCGLSAAGVAFAAILELTDAQWARPVRQTAERFAFFVPLSLVLFASIGAGARVLFSWAQRPPVVHQTWFTVGAVMARDAAALMLMTAASFWFLRRSGVHGAAGRPSAVPAAVCLLIVYAVSFTLLAADLVMSLQPGWTGTLFPAYIFTGNVYGAIAAVGIAAPLAPSTARDLGKLLLGFALLWLYLLWSQFLTIWYGNLPREFEFLVARLRGAWTPAAWLVLVLSFAVPFLLLLARRGRERRPVMIAASAALGGLWLERLVLVAGGQHFGLLATWIGAGVTLGFGALFVLSQTFAAATMRRPTEERR